MSDLTKFHEQNHKITEITSVYRYLVRERAMCETELAGNLLFDFSDRVAAHLDQVDQAITKRLLTDPDPQRQNQARKFMAESAFLKKLIREYLGAWTRKRSRRLYLKDHARFLHETDELFALVLDRIQRETEYLYPLWLDLTA
jgi:hypothetical protein